jgi:RNAse (barnase) inhibitor barstar
VKPTPSPLRAPDPPWVHLRVLEAGSSDSAPELPPGFAFRRIDGSRCRTKAALLKELARVLAFPAHFGRNWDALEDCLTDLDWLPADGYLLWFARADALLAGREADYATLVDLLDSIGRAWATRQTGHPGRAPVPFHSVLAVARSRLASRADWRIPRLD